jgi:hypothetical protein
MKVKYRLYFNYGYHIVKMRFGEFDAVKNYENGYSQNINIRMDFAPKKLQVKP